MSALAVSRGGSSETGHCSNVSDSGRLCNAPRSSVLFDGIPTLTGLEGDMWASQLLTLNTTTSSASITFDFTNPTDRYGPTTYTGVEVIEVVMFSCRFRGIGTNNVQVSANGHIVDNIVVSDSCNYLVRGCSAVPSLSSHSIILSFNKIHPHLYIAEITFFSSFSRPCSPIGPLNTSVEITSEQTFVIATSPNSQDHATDKRTYPSTFESETSEIAILLTSTQDDETTISSRSLIIPPTSESISTVIEEKNIVSTDHISTKSIQSNLYSSTELIH